MSPTIFLSLVNTSCVCLEMLETVSYIWHEYVTIRRKCIDRYNYDNIIDATSWSYNNESSSWASVWFPETNYIDGYIVEVILIILQEMQINWIGNQRIHPQTILMNISCHIPLIRGLVVIWVWLYDEYDIFSKWLTEMDVIIEMYLIIR